MNKEIRILIIEDKEDLAQDAKREINDCFSQETDNLVTIEIATEFNNGLDLARTKQFDLIILDVKDDSDDGSPDEQAGTLTYKEIIKTQFVPIIFWTAIPNSVQQFERRPIVSVIQKEDLDKIPNVITDALSTDTVTTINGLKLDVSTILNDYLWSELLEHWSEYTDNHQISDLSLILLTRLVRSLSEKTNNLYSNHPSLQYIYPPSESVRMPGDIFKSNNNEWWVLLTPACDLVPRQGGKPKADLVLLARAKDIKDIPRFKMLKKQYSKMRRKLLDYIESHNADLLNEVNSSSSTKMLEIVERLLDNENATESIDKLSLEYNKLLNLKTSFIQDIINGRMKRYFYLPKFREISDLVVDFEDIQALQFSSLQTEFTVISSLSSPYIEELLIRHSQFRTRIGLHDFNSDTIIKRLTDDLFRF